MSEAPRPPVGGPSPLKELLRPEGAGLHPTICGECGKGFSWSSGLAWHSISLTGVRPFTCSACGKGFSQNSNLATHRRIHAREKPFGCRDCGKCFGESSVLVQHRRMHTWEQPWTCRDCRKSFNVSSNTTVPMAESGSTSAWLPRASCTGSGKGRDSGSSLPIPASRMRRGIK